MKNRGFTLIELLVVIAIISFLASIILASLSSTRARASIARRSADMHQIALALEQYNIVNGHYPIVTNPNNASNAVCFECGDTSYRVPNTLSTQLNPYLKTLPKDPDVPAAGYFPTGDNRGYWYKTDPTGKDYKFVSVVSITQQSSIPASQQDPTFVGNSTLIGMAISSSERSKSWTYSCDPSSGSCSDLPFSTWLNYSGSGSGNYQSGFGLSGNFTGSGPVQSIQLNSFVGDMVTFNLSPAARVWCGTTDNGMKTNVTLPITCSYIAVAWP